MMTTQKITQLLAGKDLRSIRQNSIVVRSVQSQAEFDELFKLALHHERPIVMRAVDAIEKITKKKPEYLVPHKVQLFNILKGADHKELKWHIAQLITRVDLTSEELSHVWHLLAYWALNKNESKIVRVNALQGLFDLSNSDQKLKQDFEKILSEVEHESIASIQARVRKLKATAAKRDNR